MSILSQRYISKTEVIRENTGKVDIGIYKRDGSEVIINFKSEGMQITALGASGSGKTETLRRIAAEFFRKNKDSYVFVIDRKDTRDPPYMEYYFLEENENLKSYLKKFDKEVYTLPTKRFIPRPKTKLGENETEFKIPYSMLNIDMIREFFNINITTRYYRRVYDILREFKHNLKKSKRNPLETLINSIRTIEASSRDGPESVMNYAIDVFNSLINDKLFGNQEFEPEKDAINVLDLRPSKREVLTSHEDIFYVGAWINMIYEWWTGIPKAKRPKVLLVIDEAHNYFRRDTWTLAKENLTKLLREGRVQGFSVVLATQFMRNVDPSILEGTRWWLLIGYLTSSRDKNYICDLSRTKRKDLKVAIATTPKEEMKLRKKMRGRGWVIFQSGLPWEVVYYVAPTK